jgi:hypothetical protein
LALKLWQIFLQTYASCSVQKLEKCLKTKSGDLKNEL